MGDYFRKLKPHDQKSSCQNFPYFFSFLQIPGKDTVSQTFYHIDLHHFTSSKNQFKQYSDTGMEIEISFIMLNNTYICLFKKNLCAIV